MSTAKTPTIRTASTEHTPPPPQTSVAPVTRALALQTCAFGVLAGTTSSMVGLGGAIMVLPWLTSRCGLKQKDASGTSLAAIFLTAVGSLIAYSLNDSGAEVEGGTLPGRSSSLSSSSSSSRSHVDYRTAAAMVLASTPASMIGVRAAAALSDRRLKLALIAFQLGVTPLILFKEQLLPLAPATLGASSSALAATHASQSPLPPPLSLSSLNLSAIEPRDLRALALGAASGFAAGLFGVGGGLILVPGLFLFGPELDYKTVLGTTFACMVPTTFVGALTHMAQVRWRKTQMCTLHLPRQHLSTFICSLRLCFFTQPKHARRARWSRASLCRSVLGALSVHLAALASGARWSGKLNISCQV